jgi:hypothetical protein
MRSSSKTRPEVAVQVHPVDYAVLAEKAKAAIRMFSVSISSKEMDMGLEAARQQYITARLALVAEDASQTTRALIEREVAEFISATKAELGPIKSQFTSKTAQAARLVEIPAETLRAKPNDSLTKIVKSRPELVTLAREAITKSVECGNPTKDKVSEHSATMAAALALGTASNLHHVDRLNVGHILAMPSQGQMQAVVDAACKSKVAPKGVFTYAAISELALDKPASWQKAQGFKSLMAAPAK